MRVKVGYYSIKSDHPFAVPTLDRSEIVEYNDETVLRKHIEHQKDAYGHRYKKSRDKLFGFDYLSGRGGVKVKPYRPPKIKRI